MARHKVPHCKDCSFCIKSYKGPWDKMQYYWCKEVKLGANHFYGRYINGQEKRTSPLWCPLRAGQKCK